MVVNCLAGLAAPTRGPARSAGLCDRRTRRRHRLDEKRGVLYIANFNMHRIDVMSLATYTVERSMTVAPQPGSITLSPDSRYLVTTHYGAYESPTPSNNSLTVIDLETNGRQVYSMPGPPTPPPSASTAARWWSPPPSSCSLSRRAAPRSCSVRSPTWLSARCPPNSTPGPPTSWPPRRRLARRPGDVRPAGVQQGRHAEHRVRLRRLDARLVGLLQRHQPAYGPAW